MVDYSLLRPCVQKALKEGIDSYAAFEKMRYAICYELKRIKVDPATIKSELLRWNSRNGEYSLSIGDAQRQLCGFVDWFFSKDTKMSCKALADYCVGQHICFYHLKEMDDYSKRHHENKPHDPQTLYEYLHREFPLAAENLLATVNALKTLQVQNHVIEIFVGTKGLSNMMSALAKRPVHENTVRRAIHKLIDLNILRKTCQGKKGTFSVMANGYMFVPWTPPTIAPRKVAATEGDGSAEGRRLTPPDHVLGQ